MVDRFVADFTISGVEELCSGVSRPTIIGVLRLHPLYREGPQRQVGGISWSQPSVKPT
ncbi:protein of unknown function [Kyrpidia spormannii]|uniref:Uncharacterized protein n=1 Tax=Kyrpidia spormannii TaxID=2055160 RepID=A0ACA8Z577_9BACL|nr:protein of unknown function [Kyrpidia spormannii]